MHGFSFGVCVYSFTVDVRFSFLHGGLCLCLPFAVINRGLRSRCQCALHHPPLLDQTSALRNIFVRVHIKQLYKWPKHTAQQVASFDCTLNSCCCCTVDVVSFRNPHFQYRKGKFYSGKERISWNQSQKKPCAYWAADI